MGYVGFAKMWSLAFPGTHDTGTYRFKNYLIPKLKTLAQTQDLTVAQQLKMGIRALDIRLCYYYKNLGAPREYYTSHTFACVPLDEILHDVKDFLDNHPTEVVALSLRDDYSPLNIDIGTGNTDIIEKCNVSDINFRNEVMEYVFKFFGGRSRFIDTVDMETEIK